ncbi:hypothetical protein [Streptomyces flavofungini]|uniref:Translation initiation factor 2 n=1 Tax=Streptomyces flavofungini TaxID=68200 RepID=A0ABS0X294_9ACTN|nr:hypothetical protein [Streptomyces flavofungini]MBJ3807312.1 hypothetical protein [Streptomyces flavofungini]GHC58489.1 hypothetical protein GCM10010349_26980 [Streptomyces flavofungini]
MREPNHVHPAAPGAPARWLTVAPERTVLGVIHNVTSATRLLDLLTVFDGDRRVQTVFTRTGSSPFADGIAEFAAARELPFLPWDEAVKSEFDLAVSTSRGGDLHSISAPLIGAPHGAGYNKRLSSREPGAGSREPGAFGLTAEWLVHDGELIPSAVVLSHEEQLARLRDGCPEALPAAHVVGDPCMDRLRASLPFRAEYRAALGVRPDQRLLVLSSTWGRHSLLGAAGDLVLRALAELPSDSYRVLAAVHPNAWYGHGGWQVRSWLRPHLDAGLLLPPPAGDTWRAALCAADAFIGDHGSVTLYAAGLGLPGLLGAFDTEAVAAGSPMAALGAALPRVSPTRPLAAQLELAARDQPTDPRLGAATSQITSHPGEASARLRRLCYRVLALDEPAAPIAPWPVGVPQDLPPTPRSPVERPLFVEVRVTSGGGAGEPDGGVGGVGATGPNRPTDPTAPTELLIRRHPAPARAAATPCPALTDAHVAVTAGEPEARWALAADVVTARAPAAGPHVAALTAELFTAHPGCALVAVPQEDGGCHLHTRSGTFYLASWDSPRAWTAPSLTASVMYACLLQHGDDWEGDVLVRLTPDGAPARLRVRRLGADPVPYSN